MGNRSEGGRIVAGGPDGNNLNAGEKLTGGKTTPVPTCHWLWSHTYDHTRVRSPPPCAIPHGVLGSHPPGTTRVDDPAALGGDPIQQVGEGKDGEFPPLNQSVGDETLDPLS